MTTIMISGASSGIGAALAKKCAKQNINLVLTARREDKLQALASSLSESGVDVCVQAMDVTDSAQALHDGIINAHEKIGKIDTIIINAGIAGSRKLGTLDIQSDVGIINTNLVGAIALADAAINYFQKHNGGQLVVTSSMSALIPLANSPAYAASKIAVTHYFEAIRGRLKKRNIDITILHPGFIKTDMTNNAQAPGIKRLMISSEKASDQIFSAITQKKQTAIIPAWPWSVLAKIYQFSPRVIKKRFI